MFRLRNEAMERSDAGCWRLVLGWCVCVLCVWCVCAVCSVQAMRQVKRRERGDQWHNSTDEATQWPMVARQTHDNRRATLHMRFPLVFQTQQQRPICHLSSVHRATNDANNDTTQTMRQLNGRWWLVRRNHKSHTQHIA